MNTPLNHIECPKCGRPVDDRAVGCPNCGEKIYVEHPADITPVRNPPLEKTAPQNPDAETPGNP